MDYSGRGVLKRTQDKNYQTSVFRVIVKTVVYGGSPDDVFVDDVGFLMQISKSIEEEKLI